MMFIQFFIWGAWYVTVGNYMTRVGMTDYIYWAYTVGPIGAIISPFFSGMIADRFFATEKVLGVLHIVGGIAMYLTPFVAEENPKIPPLNYESILDLYTTLMQAIEIAEIEIERINNRPKRIKKVHKPKELKVDGYRNGLNIYFMADNAYIEIKKCKAEYIFFLCSYVKRSMLVEYFKCLTGGTIKGHKFKKENYVCRLRKLEFGFELVCNKDIHKCKYTDYDFERNYNFVSNWIGENVEAMIKKPSVDTITFD